MDAVRRLTRPVLRRPRALLAFEGWNDACEAASGTLSYLLGKFGAREPFAVIEPEDFFDFQEHRPTIRVGAGSTRRLEWPETRFFAVELPEDDRDLVVVLGEEPSFRWKTFSRIVASLLGDVGVEEVILLGAYIGQITHRSPVPLSGVATDPSLVGRNGLEPTVYEGPTGIVGVLLEAFRELGIPALGIWAATPHYLAANPNPTAMLAMARKLADVLELGEVGEVDAELDEEFRRRVDEALGDDELAQYLDDGTGDGPEVAPETTDELVTEIERFLRGLD